jgi:predicted ATPase/DNA-binding SARP family transcriptional activator
VFGASFFALNTDFMAISVKLFGHPSVEINGSLRSLRHRRPMLILCLLLARQGRPIARMALSEAIWPEFDSDSGSVNLRRAVADLRLLLGSEASRLEAVDRRELSFRVDETLTCDLLNFDVAAHRFERTAALSDAREAASLYTGTLLDGWTDECLEPERRYRQEAAAEMLEALARDALHNRNDPAEALQICRRAEPMTPNRETIGRLRIEAYLQQNDRAAAEDVFHGFTGRGGHEQVLIPLDEVVQLAGSTQLPEARRTATLPYESGLLIGRTDELAFLQEKIRRNRVSISRPSSRLTTITGPGGVGKTSLALAAARAAVADGNAAAVVFADFSHLPRRASAAAIYAVLVEALEIQAQGESRSKTRKAAIPVEKALHNLLREFTLAQTAPPPILLLDNAEHLLPIFAFVVADILQMAPSLHLLVTSRTPLHLPGEALLPLLPLSLPETDGVGDVEASGAAQLFIERARLVRPDFPLTAVTAPRIARLCRELDGIPLALEIAAARLRGLSLADMETKLKEAPFSLLSGGTATRPLRQRTVQDAIAWSWSLLSPEQQILLLRLSFFRGSWRLDLAEEVAGFAPLGAEMPVMPLLLELVEHSLLQVLPGTSAENETPRYRLLETVRVFAADRLWESMNGSAEAGQVQQRFADWAARFAQKCDDGIWGKDSAVWSEQIKWDLDNLRTGLELADAPTAQKIVRSIEAFWWRQGRYQEGIRWQEIARAKAEQAGDTYQATMLRLTEEQFRNNLGLPHQARTVFAAAIALLREREDHRAVAFLLNSLACLERDAGELRLAAVTMQEAIHLTEQLIAKGESRELQAYQWRGMAQIEVARGQYDSAATLCHRAISIYRDEDNTVHEMMTLRWLGQALLGKGDAESAYVTYAEARSLAYRNASLQIEQEAEQGLGEASLALGNPEEAKGHFHSAATLAHQNSSQEGIALAACGESALAVSLGTPDIVPTARVLFSPGAARLPYPTLVAVLMESARAARACQLPRTAQRLQIEADSARDASRSESAAPSPKDIVWSPSLAITRARAAYPSDRVSEILEGPDSHPLVAPAPFPPLSQAREGESEGRTAAVSHKPGT